MSGRHPPDDSARRRSILHGLGVAALGVAAIGIAVVEYAIFSEITGPTDAGRTWLGMSAGSAASVAAYAGAGVVLIAIGIVKAARARRGR